MPGIVATRSLAHLIVFLRSLKQSTFLLRLQNQDICPQGHVDPFSHWEYNECYHTRRPSGRKLWIWHCGRSSSFGKHFPFLPTSTTQLAGGQAVRWRPEDLTASILDYLLHLSTKDFGLVSLHTNNGGDLEFFGWWIVDSVLFDFYFLSFFFVKWNPKLPVVDGTIVLIR